MKWRVYSNELFDFLYHNIAPGLASSTVNFERVNYASLSIDKSVKTNFEKHRNIDPYRARYTSGICSCVTVGCGKCVCVSVGCGKFDPRSHGAKSTPEIQLQHQNNFHFAGF